MSTAHRAQAFRGRLLMVGCGCIGQGVLPLLLRHIDIKPEQIRVLSATTEGAEVAREYGVRHSALPLYADNFAQVLDGLLATGDFLLNLSVEVSSLALVSWCQGKGVLYLDSCTEPWPGGYTDSHLPLSARSNYGLREAMLGLRPGGRHRPTAVLTHGANPGLVSHLVKQALLNIAADLGQPAPPPSTKDEWAHLAQHLGIRTIHIAERDTQLAARRKADGEFVNTWSVDGFASEAFQPAELGWGSHERRFPSDGFRHGYGCQAGIALTRPGAATRVRTWTPLTGPTLGFMITHSEALSIADYFTVGGGEMPEYRPTVHYAYHPCDDAVLSLHELAGRNWRLQTRKRVLKDEIVTGDDALGVLLMGHARGAYWYGSQLSTEAARALCPHNSATSLQVTAAVMAGVTWAMQNPQRGLVEPDEMPYDTILGMCAPYLGKLFGVYDDWTPLRDRELLFPEDLDRADPWQFKNFRVV